MIQIETIEINGKTFKKTYSDQGLYIINKRTGDYYEVAFDSLIRTNIYIESDKEIE